jgi:hypothetical protein
MSMGKKGKSKGKKGGSSGGSGPTGPSVCGCGDGTEDNVEINGDRPRVIEFTLVRAAPIGQDVLQSGKGGSTGFDMTLCENAAATVQCYDNKGDTIFLGPTVVTFGSNFIVNPQFEAETECTVTCGAGNEQVVDIHTSCSKPLFVGQNFGAIVVANFPDVAGCVASVLLGKSSNAQTSVSGAGGTPTIAAPVAAIMVVAVLVVIVAMVALKRRTPLAMLQYGNAEMEWDDLYLSESSHTTVSYN